VASLRQGARVPTMLGLNSIATVERTQRRTEMNPKNRNPTEDDQTGESARNAEAGESGESGKHGDMGTLTPVVQKRGERKGQGVEKRPPGEAELDAARAESAPVGAKAGKD